MVAFNTYSFKNINGSLVGPGGAVPLGNTAGPTEEGVTIAFKEEIDNMQMGADGQVMHSLRAGRPGRATLRYLKTSPVNAVLSLMFNFQQSASSLWGENVLEFIDQMRGDSITLVNAAFVKPPDITYDRDGRYNEWTFDGVLTQILGVGSPNLSDVGTLNFSAQVQGGGS
jgi:hypothetical protein